ncbi:unnamed protein product, partial [Mesorhabditis spiculigera]
ADADSSTIVPVIIAPVAPSRTTEAKCLVDLEESMSSTVRPAAARTFFDADSGRWLPMVESAPLTHVLAGLLATDEHEAAPSTIPELLPPW